MNRFEFALEDASEDVDEARARYYERIYIIRGELSRMCKIGWSVDVNKRLRAIQASSGEKLELLALFAGSREVEQHLHRKFAADRVHGEWFRESPALLSLIEVTRKAAFQHNAWRFLVKEVNEDVAGRMRTMIHIGDEFFKESLWHLEHDPVTGRRKSIKKPRYAKRSRKNADPVKAEATEKQPEGSS